MKKYLSLLVCSLWVQICQASTITAEIEYVQVNNKTAFPNAAAVKPNSISSNRPACASDPQGRYSFSLETEAGKAIYSMALAAKMGNKKLAITGTNNCFAGALEEIDFVRIVD